MRAAVGQFDARWISDSIKSMAMDSDRLPPALEAFQTILATGDDRDASMGILNSTGITDKTDALFYGGDVEEIERSLRAAERDLTEADA